jgi:hypothetical protein
MIDEVTVREEKLSRAASENDYGIFMQGDRKHTVTLNFRDSKPGPLEYLEDVLIITWRGGYT